MPADLFDVRPESRGPARRRGGTVLCSIVLHAGVVFVIITAQLAIATASPDIVRGVPAFLIVPAPPPLLPAPVAPAEPRQTLPSVSPTAAPISAPDHIDLTPPAPAPALTLPSLSGHTVAGPWLRHQEGTPAQGLSRPAPPPPPEPVRVGGVIDAPTRLTYVAPEYPALARSARIEGTVILEATIDDAGVVRHVEVLRSIALLDDAAVAAVSRWRYTPTRLNGTAVPVRMTVTVRFRLR
jgi:protein TonB